MRAINKFFAKFIYSNKNKYDKKTLMTPTEIKFYDMLKEIIKEDFILQSQIPFASVIRRVGKHKYQNELYRTIDYGIFNKTDYKPILLIELNDPTHRRRNRRKRDAIVESICKNADLNLMKFWVDKPNEYDYVRNRILSALYSNKDSIV